MRGIEQTPILAYAIIIVIVYLVVTDQDLLNLIPSEAIFVGMAIVAGIMYSKMRNQRSEYV